MRRYYDIGLSEDVEVGFSPFDILKTAKSKFDEHIRSEAAKGAKAAVAPVARQQASEGAKEAVKPWLIGAVAVSGLALFLAMRK